MNLILDEDEDPENDVWPHLYDPQYDFLFGKVGPGLPWNVWEGHKAFATIDDVPDHLKQSLQDYANMELERKFSETEEGKKPLSPKASAEVNVINHQAFEKKPTASELGHDDDAEMQAHFEEIRNEFVKNINFTVFSKTKFDEGLEDDALL